MSKQHHDPTYSGSAAENYERHFVPAIGAPLANDLVEIADLRPGERLLDVACGTGVATRREHPDYCRTHRPISRSCFALTLEARRA